MPHYVSPSGITRGSPPLLSTKFTGLDINIQLESRNPVVDSSEFAYKATNLVKINERGVKAAAQYIRNKLRAEAYTPRTWRTHPLHICPNEPYDATDPQNKKVLDWIFLISTWNFSFWSELAGTEHRFGIEWRKAWNDDTKTVHTGYWSLVAALNRALEDDGIPITDPYFYSSPKLCPDSLIEHVFRPAAQSKESIPLFQERIAVMREVGSILCNRFNGSYQGFLEAFQRRYDGNGTALDLVKMVAETFPSFRDEVVYAGRKVCLWKRTQILVAETWAAFYPPPTYPPLPHPIFPGPSGPCIHDLTMFADYRVPQILHHLRILEYPDILVKLLEEGVMLAPGTREEVSLRASGIVAVERIRKEILNIILDERIKERKTTRQENGDGGQGVDLQIVINGHKDNAIVDPEEVTSVLIDFYLWDLAKKVESGEEKIEGIETAEVVPVHRTRSIWY
ncbi:hypothetical protein AX16_008340 [Volvariella volvacea WC 439]|nr:hypothetical protein AX16_008340 [Volvariella volvacea WC 439]